jgi:hypothetical protein
VFVLLMFPECKPSAICVTGRSVYRKRRDSSG